MEGDSCSWQDSEGWHPISGPVRIRESILPDFSRVGRQPSYVAIRYSVCTLLVSLHSVIPVATDDPLLPQAEKQMERGSRWKCGYQRSRGSHVSPKECWFCHRQGAQALALHTPPLTSSQRCWMAFRMNATGSGKPAAKESVKAPRKKETFSNAVNMALVVTQ